MKTILNKANNTLYGFLRELSSNISAHKGLYLLLIPGLLYFFIFHYIPMYGVLVAFKDFRFADGIIGSEWVGFKHFALLFGSTDFYRIFRNNLMINLLKLLFGFPGPIILAILINEVKNIYFKKSVQTIFYFPHFLSWVIVGGIVFKIFGINGVVNEFSHIMGLKPIQFLTSSQWFWPIVVMSSIWKEVGWGAIIYLATISNIDPNLYEASYVDGANKFRQILHITLPGLRSVMIILFILRVGQMMAVGFEQIFILYNPMVYDVGDVFSTYIYRVGLQLGRYSYTAGLDLFQNFVGLILILITNRIANRVGEYGIW